MVLHDLVHALIHLLHSRAFKLVIRPTRAMAVMQGRSSREHAPWLSLVRPQRIV